MLDSRINSAVHLIKTDLFRYAGRSTFKSFLKTYLKEPGFNFLVWLRLGKSFKSTPFRYLFRVVLNRKKIRFGIDISPDASIGEGFYIGHFGHIVVNSSTVIGKNCNISQGVTIGIANTGEKKGVPSIGDQVYIAPGAKIIGRIRIGNNVAIGANAVVTNDIPDYSVVVGVPARVVSKDGSVGYIQNIVVS